MDQYMLSALVNQSELCYTEEEQRKEDPEAILQEFRIQWKRELQDNESKQGEAAKEPLETDAEHQAKLLFLHGTKAEQNGSLYEAIQYYRRAMQLVPDIERKIVFLPMRTNRGRQESESSLGSLDLEDNCEDDLVQHFNQLRVQHGYGKSCQEDSEKNETHISVLPMELIIYILKWVISAELDLKSLENISEVCRGFYLCARDEELWRLICMKTWGASCGSCKKYGGWRNMSLQKPHLLFNGCYICKCTYMREGEPSIDGFYRPWHLIKYYRYARFFSDGTVLMQTSPEDPVVTLAKLRSKHSKDQGILKGAYKMTGSRISAALRRVQVKESGYHRYTRMKHAEKNTHDTNKTFHVEFEVSDAGSRKHAKLSWLQYSVHTKYMHTGKEIVDEFELNNKTYPPLIFSRVKSYCCFAGTPLQQKIF